MKKEDLIYLCTTIGNLAGVPLRLYENDELVFYHALVDLPRDPMDMYRQEIWAIQSHIGYFATPFFNYYGIINSVPYKIVIGPTRQVDSTDHELRTQAFQADVPPEDVDAFVIAMRSIVRMPLDSILQMLCTVNFVLNQEKRNLGDITIFDAEQGQMMEDITDAKLHFDLEDVPFQMDAYTSYSVEQQLMDIVRKGDTAALQEWVATAPAIRAGILSTDQLRQLKNVFIVSTTLASRAAIRGGLDTKTSFFLSDAYIQRCELLKTADQISNLQYHMIYDYTERVERIRIGKHPSQLSIQVANYVQNHLSEVISVDNIAKELYISRSRLSARFKEETGYTLTDFVMREKIREAKRLLRYTEKPLNAISNYLGFSSQSHFSRVFKKYADCTPGEYRDNFIQGKH